MKQSRYNPGFRFKDGKLFIFHEEEVTVITGWPELNAVSKTALAKRWRAYWPYFRLIQPYRRPVAPKAKTEAQQLTFDLGIGASIDPATERKRALDSFRFSFPKPIAASVERFLCEQWAILHLLKDDPNAVDLVSTHPAIGFLLAQHCKGQIKGRSDLPRFSHIKQKVLAHKFGFPETDAAVNILRKVPPESLNSRRLIQLRTALANPEIQKNLSHLEVINAGVIELVGDPELWRQTAPRLLQEVAGHRAENYRAETAESLHQILIMERTVRPGRCSTFQSRERLQKFHDELTLEYCRRAPEEVKNCVFPRPPLPGATNCIVPLRSPADLIEEGRMQSNCVASYAKQVEDGDIFIYRVLFPERATLSIVRHDHGTWELGELKAAGNARVSAATERMVENWLAQFFNT